MSICRKLQVNVSVPDEYIGTCCGQIFSSKGFTDAYRFTANRIICQLWTASKQGYLPIVTDVSSCAYTLLQLRHALTEENKSKFDSLRILDSVDFLHDMVLPRVKPVPLGKKVVLHPVCSLQKMRTEQKLIKVARHFAETVHVPVNAGCCGMAGDRGFLFPELIESATAGEVSEVKLNNYDGYYSTTKTCEIAMSMASARNYESILYLVDAALP
jgi:D-lactate dehydrogenase